MSQSCFNLVGIPPAVGKSDCTQGLYDPPQHACVDGISGPPYPRLSPPQPTRRPAKQKPQCTASCKHTTGSHHHNRITLTATNALAYHSSKTVILTTLLRNKSLFARRKSLIHRFLPSHSRRILSLCCNLPKLSSTTPDAFSPSFGARPMTSSRS